MVVTIIALLIIFWQAIAATCRTLISQQAVLGMFVVAIGLYAAVCFKWSLPFGVGSHLIRWEYTATILLIIAEVVVGSWLLQTGVTAKKEPKFLADDPEKIKGKFTDSQRIALTNLRGMIESGEPRSIALTGDWGTGKSAIIEELKGEISNQPNIIYVYFRPWPYISEEALVQGFYAEIAQQMREGIPGLQEGPFGRMSSSVEKLVDKHDKTGLFAFFMMLTRRAFGDDGVPEDKIQKILQRERKQLLIVIDDVERAHNPHILYRSLQLAQHARRIEHAQVITVFEKDSILAARLDHVLHPEEYLEKFFEIEIHVPNGDDGSLRKFMKDNDKKSSILPGYISSNLLREIKTHRGAIRVMNEIILQGDAWDVVSDQYAHIKSFKTSIHKGDLLAITHIKLKYPRLFDDIDKNRSFYTQPLYQSEEYFAAHLAEEGEDQKKSGYIDRLFDDMKLSVERRATLGLLLAETFPEQAKALGDSSRGVNYSEMRANKRLGLREVLDAYFGITSNLEVLQKHETQADKVLVALIDENVDDKKLIGAFKTYISYARKQPGKWSDVVGILFNEITNNDQYVEFYARAARAALLAVASNGAHYGRADLTAISHVFYLVEELFLHRSSTGKQRLLRDVFDVDVLKKCLNNPPAAVYIATMEMSDAARRIAKVAQSSGLKDQLEVMVIEFLKEYFTKRDIMTESRGSEYLYVLESWLRLEEASGKRGGLRSAAHYIKNQVIKYQSDFLSLLVRKLRTGGYELTDEGRFFNFLIQQCVEYVNPDKLQGDDKGRFEFLKRIKDSSRS
jgi:hypothetical protein